MGISVVYEEPNNILDFLLPEKNRHLHMSYNELDLKHISCFITMLMMIIAELKIFDSSQELNLVQTLLPL